MAEKAPTSYKDPFWQGLSASTESRLGLPEGLLTSVVNLGERSNADQVSSAGARTPYQITPATRKLVIDKYGLDPYLSPENAAEAAGLLLKESLERNQGNAAEAVSEYHGGTDRSNWGPITRAYTARVMSGMPQSTFQRALMRQEASQPAEASIAAVYDAYQSGRMSPDEAAQFESDVNDGLVMLPRGASLTGVKPQTPGGTQTPEPVTLPQGIADAYASGQLGEQERADLEADIREGIVRLPAPTGALPVETETGAFVQPTEQGIIQTPREPTIGERLAGAGETALALGTGMTGGAVGQIGGTVKGLGQAIMDGSFGTQEAADMVERQAMEGAEALTYMPRGDVGQRYTQNIGELLMQTVPAVGLTGEIGQLAAGIRSAAPGVQAAAQPGVAAAQRGAQIAARGAGEAAGAIRAAPGRVMEAVGLRAAPEDVVAAPSAGAAGVEASTIRGMKAESLPVPVELTKGAQTRDAAQLAFEKEQMKGELGAPLRKRAEENNLQVMQNFEALLDESGAAAPDLAATGNKVIDALSSGYKAAKTQTNAAYAKARASQEAQAPVNPGAKVAIGEGDNALETSLIEYLNSKIQGVPSASVTDAARKIAVKVGIATEDDAGNLVARPATVEKMEEFRRELSGTAKWDDRVGLRDETIIKKIVDAQTEPVAGPLFKEARKLRTEQARKYENRAIVARLITNRKGMDDPQVAVDQVFNRSVLNGSPEEITFLKRVLNTSGDDGRQAWKEVQAATIRHIRDEATKGMGMDSADNPLVSPAKLHQVVTTLDKNNRLDIVLGKQQAQIVRDLNDVARYINTVPPGTLINNSGTVGTLLAAIGEAGATGALTGLPVPAIAIMKALSRNIQSKKLKLKINAALNAKPSEKPQF